MHAKSIYLRNWILLLLFVFFRIHTHTYITHTREITAFELSETSRLPTHDHQDHD